MSKPDKPYQDMGLWYYPYLPAGMRPATKDDFVTALGDVKKGLKFLVRSDIHDNYEAHEIKADNAWERWREAVEMGKVWVKA